MKQQQRLLILLFALCLGTANAWAEETLCKQTIFNSQNNSQGVSSYTTTWSNTTEGFTVNIANANNNNNQWAYIKMGSKNAALIGTITTTSAINEPITKVVLTIDAITASNVNIITLATSSDGKTYTDVGTFDKSKGEKEIVLPSPTTNLYYKISADCKKSSNGVIQISKVQFYNETSTSPCTQLSTPTNLAVKNITSSTADISWDAVPNATKYKVTCVGNDVTIEKEVSATSDQLTGLDASSQYLWSVKAIGDGTTYCDSKESDAEDFTTLAPSAPCTPLTTPTELNASAATYSTATLTWSATTNATKYQVTLTPAGGAAKTDEATGTTYTATDLTPETTYTWTVKAIGNGTTYCDSEESTNDTFTTPAKPKYTITWSTPNGTSTTQVTQGEKIGTLPAEPKAPIGCSDKVFMGWSATNIGNTDNAPAFITAETVPSGDVTYYAVFATKEGSGVAGWTLVTSESDLVVGQIYTIASSATPNSGKVLGAKSTNNYSEADWTSAATTPTKLTLGGSTNAWTLNDGTGYLYAASSSKNYLQTQTNNDKNGQWSITFSSNAAIIKAQGTNTHNVIKYNSSSKLFSCYTGGQNAVYLFKYSAGSTYTDYVTNCVDCTAPTAPLALSVAKATLNLGEDGKAMTTFSTTDGNGGTIDYVVNPTAGADIDKDNKTITFTQAGTYTLTALQDLNTTDGTTYCGSRDSKTITVTSTPVLYFTTTPADPIAFSEVECGGNTPLNQKQQISLQGYNLIGDVSVAVTGGYKIARTASATLGDYTTEFTLPKTTEGKINATYSSVYVLSCPPAQSNSATSGTLTITTDKGNTLTVNLSTPTVTCKEYTLTLNDRGSKSDDGSYYAGATVSQPADPTGVCTEPINYVFDGWATAEVANGSTTYTSVSFPYTMPKGNTTLYAVYKYAEGEGVSKVSAADIVDGGKYYITATYNDTEYMLKAGAFTKGNSAGKTSTFDEETVTEDMAWTFVKSSNEWSIQSNGSKLGTTNDNNELSSSTSNSNTWTCEATTAGSTTVKLTYPSKNNRILSLYNGQNWRTYTGNSGVQAIQLYSATAYSYTTSPVCGPYIKATGDVAITSGKGIWVESVTPLTISAKNLDKNDDGAVVTITATSQNAAFTIKGKDVNGAGAQSLSITNYTKATLDTTLTVVYTPTKDNGNDEGEIVLSVTRYNGQKESATASIKVRGRSLPAEFVIAAKTADGWVALPSDLGIGSTSALKVPYSITVNDEDNPTLAIQAPTTTIYTSAERSAKNTAATAIRLKNANNHYLQGSTATGGTNVWLSNQNSEQAQSWELRGEDFKHYFVRMQASESGRYLSYDATQGKIGNYKQMSSLHILPVENTCVRFDAPKLDVHTLASTSATLRWEAIEGVTDYEYSKDGEQTWTPCVGIQTTGIEVKWTLDGLKANEPYTVYVRAKVADGERNCSASDSETFTTTDCDDVPKDLHASVKADGAAITWTCNASTATLKIYTDAMGNDVKSMFDNVTSPYEVTGLEQGTEYYYQVFANGTCGSAIEHFITETNELNIVEWKPDAVVINLNTEITAEDQVSAIVENQVTHGSNSKNVAEDLFFSKYYEASGNLKLVAIYNGTRDTLPLTDIQLNIGKSKWNTTIQMNQYGKFKTGYIVPDEEIIIWHKSTTKSTNECVESVMDVSIMDENTSLSFGGRASIGLFRSGTLIDIIGAGTAATSIEGTCRPSWGDANGWCGSGYNIENPTEEIELSTNRCLLVRSNKVKSGANAVANNTSTFATLTKEEWLGRQVPNDDDTEEATSCAGFAYVADFNYNDYYTTYETVSEMENLGTPNADGTYTIPIDRLDTMACTNLRLLLKKKDGTIVAAKEQKIPIIVNQSVGTDDATYFGGDKRTAEICKECDVVVRDNATLSVATAGKNTVRDVMVYQGSMLTIPNGTEYNANSLSLRRREMTSGDEVASLDYQGTLNLPTESDKAVFLDLLISANNWHFLSLPYDCTIDEVTFSNGQTAKYGTDWFLMTYDGATRAATQQTGNNWKPYNGTTIEAGKGYVVGIKGNTAKPAYISELRFPMSNTVLTKEKTDKTVSVKAWGAGTEARPNHKGWNLIGNPYLNEYKKEGTNDFEGLISGYLVQDAETGYWSLDTEGERNHPYIVIPQNFGWAAYTQVLTSATPLSPFTSYFVQITGASAGEDRDIAFASDQRGRSAMPALNAARTNEPVIVAVALSNAAGEADKTSLVIDDRYTDDYEMDADFFKWFGDRYRHYTLPVVYTIGADGGKRAFNALSEASAQQPISIGYFASQQGDYTFSLDRATDLARVAEVWLYDVLTGTYTNLLQQDYTFHSNPTDGTGRFTFNVRLLPNMDTDVDAAKSTDLRISSSDRTLTVTGLPESAHIWLYDATGKLIATEHTNVWQRTYSVPQQGTYFVRVATATGSNTLSTVVK